MREVEMQRELSSRVGPMPSAAPSEITAATHAVRSHIAQLGPAARGTVICCHTVVWCGLQQRSLTPQSAPSPASQPASARTTPSAAPDEFSAHFAQINGSAAKWRECNRSCRGESVGLAMERADGLWLSDVTALGRGTLL